MATTLFEAPETEREKLPAVTARYRGRCLLCRDRIYRDHDLIVKLDGEWVHDICAEGQGYEIIGDVPRG